MDVQTLLAFSLLLLAGAYLILRVLRRLRGDGEHGCANCGSLPEKRMENKKGA
jgi:hypothetical protein